MPSLGVGSGIAAQQLSARLSKEEDINRREQERVNQEDIKNKLDKRRADQRDEGIIQKNIQLANDNEKLLIARTKQHVQQEKELSENTELPVYMLAVNGLNIFDPDFPSRLAALNLKYRHAYASDAGRQVREQKMTEAGMEHTTKMGAAVRFPDGIQTKYRHAESVLGWEELRDMGTYDGKTGALIGMNAFAVDQAVRAKEVSAARALLNPSESAIISPSGDVTAHVRIPPAEKPPDPEKVAREKAKSDMAARKIVVRQKLRDLELYYLDLQNPDKTKKMTPEHAESELRRVSKIREDLMDSLFEDHQSASETGEASTTNPNAEQKPVTPSSPIASPKPVSAPVAPATKPAAAPSSLESKYPDLFKQYPDAKPRASAESEGSNTVASADEPHAAAHEAIRSHSALLADGGSEDDIQSSAENLTTALSDAGMPQDEIDSVHATLEGGDIPEVRPHATEPRLTYTPEKSDSAEA